MYLTDRYPGGRRNAARVSLLDFTWHSSNLPQACSWLPSMPILRGLEESALPAKGPTDVHLEYTSCRLDDRDTMKHNSKRLFGSEHCQAI